VLKDGTHASGVPSQTGPLIRTVQFGETK